MVGLDDAIVHGEVRDNLLLVVDLLLVVQHEVLFIPYTPSSFSSLVFLQALPILRNLPIFFQTSLTSVSVSSAYPITPVARGLMGIMAMLSPLRLPMPGQNRQSQPGQNRQSHSSE